MLWDILLAENTQVWDRHQHVIDLFTCNSTPDRFIVYLLKTLFAVNSKSHCPVFLLENKGTCSLRLLILSKCEGLIAHRVGD